MKENLIVNDESIKKLEKEMDNVLNMIVEEDKYSKLNPIFDTEKHKYQLLNQLNLEVQKLVQEFILRLKNGMVIFGISSKI